MEDRLRRRDVGGLMVLLFALSCRGNRADNRVELQRTEMLADASGSPVAALADGTAQVTDAATKDAATGGLDTTEAIRKGCGVDTLEVRHNAPQWRYEMQGNLDTGKPIRCRGRAWVSAQANDGGERCIRWELDDVKCVGDKESDWLHGQCLQGQICSAPTGWDLTSSLPGAAYCDPITVSPDGGAPRRIALRCIWKCRVAEYACSGQGDYLLESPAKG